MEKLFYNFKERIAKEHNLVEAICLSSSEGIIFNEKLHDLTGYRCIYKSSPYKNKHSLEKLNAFSREYLFYMK